MIIFFQKIVWEMLNYFLNNRFNLKIEGREKLNNIDNGGVIFVANHHGSFDPFFVGLAIPKEKYDKINGLRALTYYKYITRRLYGLLLSLIGAFPVYPNGGDLESALKNTLDILKEKQSLLIFPTGKRNKNFFSSDARPGVGYLSRMTNPLIVPIYIEGTYDISLMDVIKKRRSVRVVFGEPFHHSEVNNDEMNYRELSVAIMKRVEKIKNEYASR